MKRKTIIVDLDNVVYDWCGAMAAWLFKNNALPTGWTVSKAMQKYKSWEVWDDWNIPKGEFIRWWRLGIEAGEIYAKGPLLPQARESLWKLSDAEWSIFIATSRLTKFGLHDLIVENTSRWLRETNIPYRDLAFTSQKTSIAADAIVDDRADNMIRACHNQRFLFPAPHNRAEQEEYGLKVNQYCVGWPEIVEALL